MEELAAHYEGKNVQIVKVNVDENQELANEYQVSSVPVVFLIKKGNTMAAIV